MNNNNKNKKIPIIYHIPTILNSIRVLTIPSLLTSFCKLNEYLLLSLFLVNYFFNFINHIACKTNHYYKKENIIFSMFNKLFLTGSLLIMLIFLKDGLYFKVALFIGIVDFFCELSNVVDNKVNKSKIKFPMVMLFENSTFAFSIINTLADFNLLLGIILQFNKTNVVNMLSITDYVYFTNAIYIISMIRVLINIERIYINFFK